MSGPLLLPTWDQLEATHPQVVATMRAYLAQVACVLRPGSVTGADLALRSFTAYLAAEHPGLQHVRDVDRPQVEGFKTWLAARPGQNKARTLVRALQNDAARTAVAAPGRTPSPAGDETKT